MKESNSNFDRTFSTEEKIVLYGCGAQAQELLENCPKIEQILCVCDKKNYGTEFMGYPFLTIEQLKECRLNYKIAITSFRYYEEIRKKLLDIFDEDIILPYINWQTRIHYNYNKEQYLKWLSENSKDLNQISGLLADESSKKAFRHVLTGFENVTASDFMDVTLISQHNLVNYFAHGIFRLSAHEKFVDVGAYDGDTVLEFIRAANGQYDKIWAYEPDEELFSQLHKTIGSLQDKRITCIKEGVGKERGEIRFSQNENKFLSEPAETGGGVIKISAIDELNEDITLIKICIRGLDNILNVLEGAKVCCAAKKPKLAVVTALTDDGITEIPKMIQKINPEYQIYFRLTVYPQAGGQKIAACFFAK